MKVDVVRRIADVDAAQWDACAAQDNPFVEHAFLALLEETKCTGRAWQPRHLILRESNGDVVGAMPAYLRSDSYGEYIFDWSWAQAAAKAGMHYYPKITSAVPFVPATGPRVLVRPGTNVDDVRTLLGKALVDLTHDEGASSAHVLFCRDDEARVLGAAGLMRRASLQFHWRNAGWPTFDAFLDSLKHDERKQIRRERRRVNESGVDVEVMTGAEVPADLWSTLFALYTSTSDRKWGSPYLTRAFFDRIGTTLGDRALVIIARDTGTRDVVAMTLSFEKGKHIYGRHWGCTKEIPGLHFELCYYRLIERAIERGCTLVEAGAQGEHKLKRGFLPVVCHSMHHLVDRDFARAIGGFLAREREGVLAERDELNAHSPFKDPPARELVAGIDDL